MLKKLLTVVGACFGCLFAEGETGYPDLNFSLQNDSGCRVYVNSVEKVRSYLPNGHEILDAEIEKGASFSHDIWIVPIKPDDKSSGKITFEMEGDANSKFSIWWDKCSVQMSCPKGYRIKQNRDKNRFTFVLLPD